MLCIIAIRADGFLKFDGSLGIIGAGNVIDAYSPWLTKEITQFFNKLLSSWNDRQNLICCKAGENVVGGICDGVLVKRGAFFIDLHNRVRIIKMGVVGFQCTDNPPSHDNNLLI